MLTTSPWPQASAQVIPRPQPILRPQALPDNVTARAGEQTSIDVLANDIGMADVGATPQMRIEGTPQCGAAHLDGRLVVYRAESNCAGQVVQFGYSVRVHDEWVTGIITVTVMMPAAVPVVPEPPRPEPPPPEPPRSGDVASCDVKGRSWRAVRFDGGRFEKAKAPADIADFVRLLDVDTVTVAPFCMMLEAIPADEVDDYFAALPEAKVREQFPEALERPTVSVGVLQLSQKPPAVVSHRMAVAFAAHINDTGPRKVQLPSLEQYVAAAWELYLRGRDADDTSVYLVGLRNAATSGLLEWTSTPCSDEPGRFLTVGPSEERERERAGEGPLTKFCGEESRRDRMGFRFVIK